MAGLLSRDGVPGRHRLAGRAPVPAAARRLRRRVATDARSFGVIRRDRGFLLFMCSSVLASMTYVSYETLLPISLTTSHGYRPAAWGFLLIVNPLMVTVLQLRLTRRV